MSNDEDFLARWSRRKRAAAEAAPLPADEADAVAAGDEDKKLDADLDKEFDPATLPPIESITSLTDVTAFLRSGVPLELTRAALRRAWTADPAIRDFVGLAENAWDFTKPGEIPGFGPLEPTDDVAKLLAQVMNQSGRVLEGASPDEPAPDEKSACNSNVLAEGTESGSAVPPAASPSEPEGGPADSVPVLKVSDTSDAVVQHDLGRAEELEPIACRTHGGALPR